MSKRCVIVPNKLKTTLDHLFEGAIIPMDQQTELPPAKGAYLLVMAICERFDLSIKTLDNHRIEPGFYIYCGSACGPGGIKARLKRHFLPDKRKHWHVDHFSTKAGGMWALPVPLGDECDLTNHLLLSTKFSIPINGFGATDCPACQSHLMLWSGEQNNRTA